MPVQAQLREHSMQVYLTIATSQYMLLGLWRMSRRTPTSLLGLGTTPGLVEIRILLLGAVPNVYYDDQHAAFAPLSDHYNS